MLRPVYHICRKSTEYISYIEIYLSLFFVYEYQNP